MAGAALPWVASSGVEGLASLRLSLKVLPFHSLRTGIPVDHADDDARESAKGAVKLDSSTLELGQNADEPQLIGIRFNGIHLASRAAIRSARLQFSAPSTSTEPTELVIRAEVSGNAPRFSEKPHNLSSRSLTKNEIRWSPAAWRRVGESGDAQRTPDLTPLLREVIDRDDWQPGNSIVLVISGKGSRVAAAFRGRDSTPAKLVVDADETAPAPKTPTVAEPYRIRLHFGVPRHSIGEARVFDVTVQGQSVIENVRLGGTADSAAVRTIDRVLLGDWIEIQFTPKIGRPVLSGIEIQRLEE